MSLSTHYRAVLSDGTKVPVFCCPDYGTVCIGHDGRWHDLRDWNVRSLKHDVSRVTKRDVTKLYAC